MLVRLFALPSRDLDRPSGFSVRKLIAPEQQLLLAWIAKHFSMGWASEAGAALTNRPVSLFISTRGDPSELIGFCC